jgi:hypothetical protein
MEMQFERSYILHPETGSGFSEANVKSFLSIEILDSRISCLIVSSNFELRSSGVWSSFANTALHIRANAWIASLTDIRKTTKRAATTLSSL